MFNKPVGCSGCPLETKGKGFCKDKHSKKRLYRFVGEAPGKNEVDVGEPFVGKAGFVLKNWLIRAVPEMQLSSERDEIDYANTLRCLPPEIAGRPYPKGEEKLLAENACRQYDDISPLTHTIVLFGDSPQRVWFKEELEQEDAAAKRLGRDAPGVMGRVGREYFKDGKRWIMAPHPAFILRQPALVGHGQQAIAIAANANKLFEPDYIRWDDALKEMQ